MTEEELRVLLWDCASCRLQGKEEPVSGEREVTSTPVQKGREGRTSQEGEFAGVRINDSPGKARDIEMLWLSILLRVISVLTGISVSVSPIAFVFLLQACFVGCVLFTVILQSVISVIYCPMVFILPSHFYPSFYYALEF